MRVRDRRFRSEGVPGKRRLTVLGSLIGLLLLPAWAIAQELACTDCHNPGGIPAPHDPTCRDTSCLESCHEDIDLGLLRHYAGPGSPVTGDRTTTCNRCHNRPFDGVYHPYNINVSATSSTAPGVIDLNQACGQCHGGGTGQASTTGSMTAGTQVVTVTSAVGFVVGGRVVVAGAGPLGAGFESYVTSILGNDLTLANAASTTVSGVSVAQNPTVSGVTYYTKSQLAPVAQNIHDGPTYPVTFTIAVIPNTLTVNVYAQVSCAGPCPTFNYDWDWGDGTAHGSADPDMHTYGSAGAKSILLTLYQGTRTAGSVTRSVTLSPVDLPPTVAGTCDWNANTWTATIVDASDDDGPDDDAIPGDGALTVTIDWGDGSLKSFGAKGGTFVHTYRNLGSYTILHKVIDSRLNSASKNCGPVVPAYFTIDGTVKDRLGTKNLSYATVRVFKGSTVVKTVYSKPDGTFTATSIGPATYTLRVTKKGYTFANPAATITVGPSSTGNVINATAP